MMASYPTATATPPTCSSSYTPYPCFLCCSSCTSKSRLEEYITASQAKRAISNLCKYFLVPQVALEGLYICPKCLPKIQGMVGLEEKMEVLRMLMRETTEDIGKIILDSATTKAQDKRVWVLFKQRVIQNYMVGTLPNPSVKIMMNPLILEALERYGEGGKVQESDVDIGGDEEGQTERSPVVDLVNVRKDKDPYRKKYRSSMDREDEKEQQMEDRINYLFLEKNGLPPIQRNVENGIDDHQNGESSDSDLDEMFEVTRRPRLSGPKEGTADVENQGKVAKRKIGKARRGRGWTRRPRNTGDRKVRSVSPKNKITKEEDKEEEEGEDQKPTTSAARRRSPRKRKSMPARLRSPSIRVINNKRKASPSSDGKDSILDKKTPTFKRGVTKPHNPLSGKKVNLKRQSTDTNNSERQIEGQPQHQMKIPAPARRSIKVEKEVEVENEEEYEEDEQDEPILYPCPETDCILHAKPFTAFSDLVFHYETKHLSLAAKLSKSNHAFKCKVCETLVKLKIPELLMAKEDSKAVRSVTLHFLEEHRNMKEIKKPKKKAVKKNKKQRNHAPAREEKEEEMEQDGEDLPPENPKIRESSRIRVKKIEELMEEQEETKEEEEEEAEEVPPPQSVTASAGIPRGRARNKGRAKRGWGRVRGSGSLPFRKSTQEVSEAESKEKVEEEEEVREPSPKRSKSFTPQKGLSKPKSRSPPEKVPFTQPRATSKENNREESVGSSSRKSSTSSDTPLMKAKFCRPGPKSSKIKRLNKDNEKEMGEHRSIENENHETASSSVSTQENGNGENRKENETNKFTTMPPKNSGVTTTIVKLDMLNSCIISSLKGKMNSAVGAKPVPLVIASSGCFKCPECSIPWKDGYEPLLKHLWKHKTRDQKIQVLNAEKIVDLPQKLREALIQKGRDPSMFGFTHELVAGLMVYRGLYPPFNNNNQPNNHNAVSLPISPFYIRENQNKRLRCTQCSFQVNVRQEDEENEGSDDQGENQEGNNKKAEVEITVHFLEKHFENRVLCPKCGYAFSSEAYLQCHLENTHGKVKNNRGPMTVDEEVD